MLHTIESNVHIEKHPSTVAETKQKRSENRCCLLRMEAYASPFRIAFVELSPSRTVLHISAVVFGPDELRTCLRTQGWLRTPAKFMRSFGSRFSNRLIKFLASSDICTQVV